MADPAEILRAAKTVLLEDYPSQELPQALSRAGFAVVAHEGPEPDEYAAYDRDGNSHPVGHPPEHVDIVYAHRPLEELPGIVAQAKALGATTIWLQSGRDTTGGRDPKGTWMPANEVLEAEKIVEAAGLTLVVDAYIGDATT